MRMSMQQKPKKALVRQTFANTSKRKARQGKALPDYYAFKKMIERLNPDTAESACPDDWLSIPCKSWCLPRP